MEKLRPLLKPKFLAATIKAYEEANARCVGLLPPYERYDRNATTSDEKQAAHWLSLAVRLYDASLYAKHQSSISPYILEIARKTPCVSQMVFVMHTRPQHKAIQRIGQLMCIDRMPYPGQPRLYSEDGGPSGFEERYHVKLLDGSIQKWRDVSVRRLLTVREFAEAERLAKTRDSIAAELMV